MVGPWRASPLRPCLALPRRFRSFSLAPSSSSLISPSLFLFLPTCFPPSLSASRSLHHVARADLSDTRRADSVSFSPSRRALGTLSFFPSLVFDRVARIVGSPRASTSDTEHFSTAVCGPLGLPSADESCAV